MCSLSSPGSLRVKSLLAIAVLLCAAPAFSTSRRALVLLDDHTISKTETGFRVSLKRVDNKGKNVSTNKFERLQHAMKRGRERLQRLNAMTMAMTSTTTSASEVVVETSVHAGNGEFLMELAIGTPPVSFSAIMDTGSDLIWTQCKPCKQCFDQTTPVFDPKDSSSFSKLSCSTGLCQALPTSTCSSGSGSGGSCEYLYTYGDYSSTQGLLATETFTFDHKFSIPKIGFGCGDDNEGSGFNQGAGLVGLGRGPLSLVSQLREPKFSYCLTSIDDTETTSTLWMGTLATPKLNNNGSSSSSSISSMIQTNTPLIKNPSQPSFYYLSLQGITVGTTRLPIEKSTFALNQEDGSGGLIIDSGTTITYLLESAFDLVKKEFISQTKLPVDTSDSTGLDLCFNLPAEATSVEVPRLVFHFQGDGDGGGDLELPGENYMIADSSVGLMCLAMGGSTGMSIFGNVQQQNMLVLHDLQKETLSFIPTQCNQL